MRLGIAEQHDHPVAEELRDEAAAASHHVSRRLVVDANGFAVVLGIEPGRQFRRSDEVAEQHREVPPVGVSRARLQRRRSQARFWYRYSLARFGPTHRDQDVTIAGRHPANLDELFDEIVKVPVVEVELTPQRTLRHPALVVQQHGSLPHRVEKSHTASRALNRRAEDHTSKA